MGSRSKPLSLLRRYDEGYFFYLPPTHCWTSGSFGCPGCLHPRCLVIFLGYATTMCAKWTAVVSASWAVLSGCMFDGVTGVGILLMLLCCVTHVLIILAVILISRAQHRFSMGFILLCQQLPLLFSL